MATTFFQLCPSLTSTCIVVVLSLLSISFITWIIKLCVLRDEHKSKPLPPEAGGAWPIIGHFHLLGGALVPHKLLGEMADEYGPLFSIRIGVRKALVVSSWEMAKECLLLNDKVVSSRPKLIVIDIMAYGDANLAFTPYGPYWRSLRKVVALELLSNHRLDMTSYIWKEEMNVCINKLYEFWFKTKRGSGLDVVSVDLKQWFLQLEMNIVVRIIFGKSYGGCEEAEMSHFSKIIGDFFNEIGSFHIGDALPFLRWLDLGGQEKALKKTGKEMDVILDMWLQEHKQRRSSTSTEDGNKDFMDVMLAILDDTSIMTNSGFDADTINKATCLMMLAGASDTSSVFLTWAISLLLNNRDVLKKAQDELSIHVGKDRHVNESDISKLTYLQTIVKETLRLYPPAPLSGPREFVGDCTVGGFHVKKGTRLILNLPKIQSDPRVWEDPMEFRPERFLTTHKDVDVRGQSFELIPFGSGRRMCPGPSFALRNIHFILASFLHAFDFFTLNGAPIDMTESFGLTNLKATPLDVLFTPRLSTDAYE